jgi:hypothetical protein
MYRVTVTVILLVLGATVAIGQQSQTTGVSTSDPQKTPTRSEIQAMLQSNEARDQAWGAYWSSQLRETFPEIRKNLEAHMSGTKNNADFAVIDNCLDALIQTPAEPLPVDLIESVYRSGRTAEALILLTRVAPGQQSDTFLLKLLDEEAGQGVSREWYAAADIMLMEHRPGFVHSLLKGLVMDAHVVVCDPGTTCRHVGIGSGSAGDFVAGARAADLPPWPIYILQTNAPLTSLRQADSANGVSISYRRQVVQDPFLATRMRAPNESHYPPNPSTRDRFRYIAAAAPGIVLYMQDDETLSLIWTTKEAFRSESEKFETDMRGRYQKIIEQLRDRGTSHAA